MKKGGKGHSSFLIRYLLHMLHNLIKPKTFCRTIHTVSQYVVLRNILSYSFFECFYQLLQLAEVEGNHRRRGKIDLVRVHSTQTTNFLRLSSSDTRSSDM